MDRMKGAGSHWGRGVMAMGQALVIVLALAAAFVLVQYWPPRER
jgi:hypothetical protein